MTSAAGLCLMLYDRGMSEFSYDGAVDVMSYYIYCTFYSEWIHSSLQLRLALASSIPTKLEYLSHPFSYLMTFTNHL